MKKTPGGALWPLPTLKHMCMHIHMCEHVTHKRKGKKERNITTWKLKHVPLKCDQRNYEKNNCKKHCISIKIYFINLFELLGKPETFDLKSISLFWNKSTVLKQHTNLPSFKVSHKNLSKSKMCSLWKCRYGLEMTSLIFTITSFYPISLYEMVQYLSLCTL